MHGKRYIPGLSVLTRMTHFIFLATLMSTFVGTGDINAGELGEQSLSLWEYTDFVIDNPSWDGNPFDVEATALCTHSDGTTKTLRLFYDGDTTWRIRFMGNKLGQWSFVTSSADVSLDGHTGSVVVSPQTNPKIRGLLKPHAQAPRKWAVQVDDKGTEKAVVPNLIMIKNVGVWHRDPDSEVDRLLDIFGAGWNGFHFPAAGAWWDKNATGGGYTPQENQDPDIESFRAMEQLMTRFHHEGKLLHFWFQGEGNYSMKWPTMQRMMPYIAARLAPIPNWSMGMGFDGAKISSTHPTLNGFGEWRDACNDNTPYDHIFGQRRQTSSEFVDYASWEDAKWYTINYPTFIAHYQDAANYPKPLASEDRFRNRDFGAHKNLTESLSRRTLYYMTFAGGFKGIWGNLMDPDLVQQGKVFYTTVSHTTDAAQPYYNSDWFETFETAIHRVPRFRADLEPVLPQLGQSMVLADAAGNYLLHYEEDVTSVNLRLAGINGPQPVVAINTAEVYAEINLGLLGPGEHRIDLPGLSDWLLAVGDFTPEQRDNQPPQLLNIEVAPGLGQVYAIFDESIASIDQSQVTLSNGTITDISVDRDPRRIRIDVTGLQLGVSLNLRVREVSDLAGNQAALQEASTVIGTTPDAFDFANGNILGWKAIDILPTDPNAHPEQGTWVAFGDGTLQCLNARTHDSYLIISDLASRDWHDYILTADVYGRRASKIHGAQFEFIVGFEDVDHYHAFSYQEIKDNDQATVSIIQVNNGVVTPIASGSISVLAKNSSNPLRLTKRQGSIQVELDGLDLFSGPVSLPALNSGTPGLRHLRTGGRALILDNFSIESLPSVIGGGQAPTISEVKATPATVDTTSSELSVTASDPEDDFITYTWQVISAPEGAQPIIGSGSQTTVTFDQAGLYQFMVTASDGNGTDTATVDVAVKQKGSGLMIIP